MSTSSAFTSMGTCPTACTASVWNSAPCALAILHSSAMGSMVPISLLAYMMETMVVSGLSAFSSSSGCTSPNSSTGR